MTSTTPLANAGVRFPPPLLFIAGLVIGWLLHRLWPLAIPPVTSTARTVIGIVLAVGAFVTMQWAVFTFRRARTAIIPHKPATTIVTNGPFRFTRNPIYSSFVVMYVGVALLMDSWWPIILLPIILVVMQRAVIAREERYLRSAFPAEYDAYCQRVHRWF